jgi:hypothetical protein
MRAFPLGCLLATTLLASAPVSTADEPVKFEPAKFVEAKAPSVVTVKSVLKIGDSESNNERSGCVVDAQGVVMIQNWMSTRFRNPSAFKLAPTKIRVIFDGDEKEYDAVLGATDSKLGLAFVRVKDLAGKKVTAVDFSAGVEVKLGEELAGVIRTDQGFDYAPYYGTTRVVGQVTKPRSMWIVTGFLPQGHPLYTTDGRAAGVVVTQSGTTDDAGSRVFLLPTKAVTGVIAQAVKACEKALEEAKAQEAEAAAEAGMTEPTPGDAGMGETSPGMGAGNGSDGGGGMDAGK